MRPRHGREVNGLSICCGSGSAVALVVPEAVLDANNDPEIRKDDTESKSNEKE